MLLLSGDRGALKAVIHYEGREALPPLQDFLEPSLADPLIHFDPNDWEKRGRSNWWEDLEQISWDGERRRFFKR